MTNDLKSSKFQQPLQNSTVSPNTLASKSQKISQNNQAASIFEPLSKKQGASSPPNKTGSGENRFIASKPAAISEQSSVLSEKKNTEINTPEHLKGITEYRAYIENIKSKDITDTPDEEKVISKDMEYIKHFAAAENVRKPGLKLKVFDNNESFLSHLADMNGRSDGQEIRERAVIKFLDWHFISADIRSKKEPNGTTVTTVIFSNSVAGSEGENVQDMRKAIEQYKRSGVVTSGLFVGSGVQNSFTDCAIFSTSHASKFHKHEEYFSKLHDDLGKGHSELLKKSELEKPEYKTFLDEYQNGEKPDGIYGVNDLQGRILPADFYKHTQSGKRLNAIIDMRGWENETVDKRGEETLSSYRAKKMTTRSVRGEDKEQNISIENKRMVYIDRAIINMNRS